MGKLTDLHGTPTVRQLPDEEAVRMTGARSGLIHALIYTRDQMNFMRSHERSLPRHHTAKRRAIMVKVDALSKVEDRINTAQLDCDRVLKGHKALAAGRAALKAEGQHQLAEKCSAALRRRP